MLAVGASKLAAKATESAIKFGEIASQKVVGVSEAVRVHSNAVYD